MIFYKTYRLLNDGSIVDFLDISPKDVNDIVNNATRNQLRDFSYYASADGKFLLAETIEPSGGYLFHSLDDIIRMTESQIKSTTTVTAFWPEPRTFEQNTRSEIARLIQTLELDQTKVDSSGASISYLERTLMEKNFIYKQQVLSLFLGVLSYVGETLIKTRSGKWHLEIEEENRFSSWEPKIKLPSGTILDPFNDLFDGLLLWAEGKYIPVIALPVKILQV
jgi:hypothetical protein